MLVVDTSVAVKWVVPENGKGLEADTDIALGLLASALIAPDCIAAEFANALYKKVRGGEIGEDQAIASVRILPDVVTMIPTPTLLEAGLQLAIKISHPVHDCIFLALAIEQGARLITADAKFVDQCRNMGVGYPVHLLGEESWT